MNYKKELIVRSIKILDIGYITAIYFILGIILAKLCDFEKVIDKSNKRIEDGLRPDNQKNLRKVHQAR